MRPYRDGLVSVIIPCYNATKTVAESIESALASDYSDVEIVLVDDGSSDTTLDLIRTYDCDNVRVKAAPHRGLAATRNTALELARGEFIQLLDSDDLMTTDKLSKHVAFLRERPDVDVVYGDALWFSGPLDNCWLDRSVWFERPPEDFIAAFCRENVFAPHAPLFRHAAFDDVGGFNEQMSARQDAELWVRLALADKCFERMPGIVAYYRIHAGQKTKKAGQMQKNLDTLFRNIAQILGPDTYRCHELFYSEAYLRGLTMTSFSDNPELAAKAAEQFLIPLDECERHGWQWGRGAGFTPEHFATMFGSACHGLRSAGLEAESRAIEQRFVTFLQSCPGPTWGRCTLPMVLFFLDRVIQLVRCWGGHGLNAELVDELSDRWKEVVQGARAPRPCHPAIPAVDAGAGDLSPEAADRRLQKALQTPVEGLLAWKEALKLFSGEVSSFLDETSLDEIPPVDRFLRTHRTMLTLTQLVKLNAAFADSPDSFEEIKEGIVPLLQMVDEHWSQFTEKERNSVRQTLVVLMRGMFVDKADPPPSDAALFAALNPVRMRLGVVEEGAGINVQRVRRVIRENGVERAVFYGAGRFTRRMLALGGDVIPELQAVADDRHGAMSPQLLGIPVIDPKESLRHGDAVIIATNTIEQRLYCQARLILGKRVPVFLADPDNADQPNAWKSEATRLAGKIRRIVREGEHRKVALYGAGIHTLKLLALADDPLPEVVQIADDSQALWGTELAGRPIMSLESAVRNTTALIVSSDTHEAVMAQKACKVLGPTHAIYTLYA